MLIIEGSDCVGKTTLCKSLEALTGNVYQHLSVPPKGWKDIDYMKLASDNSIRDRFHLSEPIYSKIRNAKSCIDDVRILHSSLILKFSAFSVVITADEDLIRQRFGEKDEMYNLEQVLEVNKQFRKLAGFADLYFHCTTSNPFVTDLQSIVQAYTARKLYLESWKDTVKNS